MIFRELEERMATLAEEFVRAGLQPSPEDFTALVMEAIKELPTVNPGADPRHELTKAEVAALERGGFDLRPIDYGKNDPLARTAAEYTALLATSMSVTHVAGMLHVDSSRIRQRLLQRTLYGIKVRGIWHLPIFQFDDRVVLPGIDKVISALDPQLHPVAVYRWFTSPDADFEIGGIAVSPRDWLRMGGNPELVVAFAGAL